MLDINVTDQYLNDKISEFFLKCQIQKFELHMLNIEHIEEKYVLT